MRRSKTLTRAAIKAACIGIGFVLLAGCQEHKPDVVMVDLAQVPAPSLPAVPETIVTRAPQQESSALTFEGVAPMQAKGGLDSREVTAAIRQIEQRRRETARRLEEIAERATAQQSDALERSLAGTRAQEYYAWMDEAAARTRIPFERYAPRIGELRRELANLIPFPGTKPRTAPRDAIAERQQARAKAIVEEIDGLDAAYRVEIRAIYAAVDRRLKEREQTDRAAVASFRAQARSASLRAQRALLADASTRPENLVSQGGPASIKGVAGRTLRTSAASSAAIEMRSASPKVPSDVILQRDLEIWLSLNGFRLAKPGERGTDKTQEFIQWRNQHKLGP